MRLVIIESPYAGEIEANVAYARAAMRDSLNRGEAPIASHLLYTQPGILRDEVPEERQWGIDAGLAWRKVAEKAVFYTDRGWSGGMLAAKATYEREGFPFDVRSLAPNPMRTPHEDIERGSGASGEGDVPWPTERDARSRHKRNSALHGRLGQKGRPCSSYSLWNGGGGVSRKANLALMDDAVVERIANIVGPQSAAAKAINEVRRLRDEGEDAVIVASSNSFRICSRQFAELMCNPPSPHTGEGE